MLVGAGRAGEGERTVMAVLAGAGVGVGDCGQVQGREETTGSVGTPPRHCHRSLTLSPVWMEARRERAAHCSQQSVHTAHFYPDRV